MARHPVRGTSERCAHCGSTGAPVTALLRGSVVTYCSIGCQEDHLAALALATPTCRTPGCDLDAAADVPYCDAHLDVAVPPPLRGGRAA